MRTRLFTADLSDVIYGKGIAAYAINTPEAVGLAALTRMELWTNQWFLNLADGTNWETGVLGVRTQGIRDALIRARLLGTPNVFGIASYSSTFNPLNRDYSWSASLQTAFGTTGIISGGSPAI
jgi:hypothetical protein